MKRSLLALSLGLACAEGHAQTATTYDVVSPDPVYWQVSLDLGNGNTCYAFHRGYDPDSTCTELMWTMPDQSVTNAVAYHTPQGSAMVGLVDAVRLNNGLLMSGRISGGPV